jgi:hypothetical protein
MKLVFTRKYLEDHGFKPWQNERPGFLSPEYLGLDTNNVWVIARQQGEEDYVIHATKSRSRRIKSEHEIQQDPRLTSSRTIPDLLKALED